MSNHDSWQYSGILTISSTTRRYSRSFRTTCIGHCYFSNVGLRIYRERPIIRHVDQTTNMCGNLTLSTHGLGKYSRISIEILAYTPMDTEWNLVKMLYIWTQILFSPHRNSFTLNLLSILLHIQLTIRSLLQMTFKNKTSIFKIQYVWLILWYITRLSYTHTLSIEYQGAEISIFMIMIH